jgi:hypothetical protein
MMGYSKNQPIGINCQKSLFCHQENYTGPIRSSDPFAVDAIKSTNSQKSQKLSMSSHNASRLRSSNTIIKD